MNQGKIKAVIILVDVLVLTVILLWGINIVASNNTLVQEVQSIDDWRTHPQDFKLIAFTFDDAPYAETSKDVDRTKQIVDILNKYDGSGTFFVIGSRVSEYGTALLLYAVDNGCELGNHTYTHADITSLEFVLENKDFNKNEYLQNEILAVNDMIKEQMDIELKFFRASGLHTTEYSIEACMEAGMPIIAGNQSESGVYNVKTAPTDWNTNTTSDHIKSAVLDYAYDGKIVLLHSTSQTMVEVLDEICTELYDEGYRFVTLSELFEYKLGITDISEVDVAKSLSGTRNAQGIYDIEDVVLETENLK